MKKEYCLIQLRSLPDAIIIGSDHAIDEQMFIDSIAADSILKGEMFSPSCCFWHYGSVFPVERALKICEILFSKFDIQSQLIYLLDD